MGKLSGRERKLWADSLKAGRLFFTQGYGINHRINGFYQRKKLGLPKGTIIPNHVGVIATCGMGYQSTLFGGGPHTITMGSLLTNGRQKIYVCELKAKPTQEEVMRGLKALDKFVGQFGKKEPDYDWISLVTFGWLQENNSSTCSELGQLFKREVLRKRDETQEMHSDRLVLPAQLFQQCDIKLVIEVGK